MPSIVIAATRNKITVTKVKLETIKDSYTGYAFLFVFFFPRQNTCYGFVMREGTPMIYGRLQKGCPNIIQAAF